METAVLDEECNRAARHCFEYRRHVSDGDRLARHFVCLGVFNRDLYGSPVTTLELELPLQRNC
jgi:hypothetical protein